MYSDECKKYTATHGNCTGCPHNAVCNAEVTALINVVGKMFEGASPDDVSFTFERDIAIYNAGCKVELDEVLS